MARNEKGKNTRSCRGMVRRETFYRGGALRVPEDVILKRGETIPGMTPNSLFPLAARRAGLSMTDFLDRAAVLSLDSTDSGELCPCQGYENARPADLCL